MAKASVADKIAKILKNLQDSTGLEIDVPLESYEDKMREAESVAIYFATGGQHFKRIVCDVCLREFAYSFRHSGIKSCSITCMSAKLTHMGLKWNPETEPERRWGHTVPAIVPPDALAMLDELLKEQENVNSSKTG